MIHQRRNSFVKSFNGSVQQAFLLHKWYTFHNRVNTEKSIIMTANIQTLHFILIHDFNFNNSKNLLYLTIFFLMHGFEIMFCLHKLPKQNKQLVIVWICSLIKYIKKEYWYPLQIFCAPEETTEDAYLLRIIELYNLSNVPTTIGWDCCTWRRLEV